MTPETLPRPRPDGQNEETLPTKEDIALEFLLKYGLTPYAFNALTEAAQVIVDTGDRPEALRVFFNQIFNFCKDARIDSRQIFMELADDLNNRIWSQ